MNADIRTTGEQIRKARRKMGLSQIEVAEIADVSRRTVQHAEMETRELKLATLHAISCAVGIRPVDSSAPDKVGNFDSFRWWPFRLWEFMGRRFSPDELTFCDCEKEFHKILETMHRNLNQRLELLPPDQRQKLEKHHASFLTQEGYFKRYLSIWHANPNAFSFSSAHGKRTGVSICLPVGNETYQQFRSGKLSNFDIDGSCLLRESSTVIFESLASLSGSRHQKHSLSNSLAFVSFHQTAKLLRDIGKHGCRIATFAAHPENANRIRRAGMSPVGTQSQGLEFDIWELASGTSGSNQFDATESSILNSTTLTHYLSLKQTLAQKFRTTRMLTALKIYQRLKRGNCSSGLESVQRQQRVA